MSGKSLEDVWRKIQEDANRRRDSERREIERANEARELQRKEWQRRNRVYESLSQSSLSQSSNSGGSAREGLPTTPPLVLTYTDIGSASVSSPSSVSQWNTLFDLPANGGAFTRCIVDGNSVKLYGGSGITLNNELFNGATELVSVSDQAGCVVSANDYSFANCSSLSSIYLPALSSMGYYVFDNCDSIVSIAEVDMPLVTGLPNGTFRNCGSLVSIDLPNVTTIGNSCFTLDYLLTSVNLPNVTSVGYFGFKDCGSLSVISLPLATSVGLSCFDGCSSLSTIDLSSCIMLGGSPADNNVFNLVGPGLVELTVPSFLQTINSGNPDGDIVTLNSNSVLTVHYV